MLPPWSTTYRWWSLADPEAHLPAPTSLEVPRRLGLRPPRAARRLTPPPNPRRRRGSRRGGARSCPSSIARRGSPLRGMESGPQGPRLLGVPPAPDGVVGGPHRHPGHEDQRQPLVDALEWGEEPAWDGLRQRVRPEDEQHHGRPEQADHPSERRADAEPSQEERRPYRHQHV